MSVTAGVSLASRLVLVMVLLLLLIQAAVFFSTREAMQRQAATEIETSLEVGERILQRLLVQDAERLGDAASVLASDFGFRSAIGTGDTDTIESALENSAARIGASVASFLDLRFQLLAATRESSATLRGTLETLGPALAEGRHDDDLAILQGVPYQFVLAPVRSPLLVGWVMMGFPVDATLARDFERLSGTSAAFFARMGDEPWQSVGASLESDNWRYTIHPERGTSKATIDGASFASRILYLPAAGGELAVVLVRSIDELMAPFTRLQQVLAVLTLVGIVCFTLISLLAAARVTRPLAQLTRATSRLEQGDFDVRIEGTDRGDEVGRLARGFQNMQTGLANQREEIMRLAYWDTLTGLPNREQFRRCLGEVIDAARSSSKPVTVVLLDLDRFKPVNDVLGYAFGDRLLQAVAERLREQTGASARMVARLDGDHFAIILLNTDARQGDALAAQWQQQLLLPLTLDGHTIDLSASFGVASWPESTDHPATLINRAEIAMDAAKARGVGHLVYEPSMDSASLQSLSLLTDLRTALDTGQLQLYLQPKVAAQSGKLVGAEALIRWIHPVRGMIPPMAFIPFAEQTGFIRQLTQWVFDAVADAAMALRAHGLSIPLSLNLSTRDLLDVQLPARLLDRLAQHPVLRPSDFCLEITESAIMEDPKRARHTLIELAEHGFRLSIDDFGTGHSSLAYLQALPVHELKIDRSFLRDFVTTDRNRLIVKSTVELAHALNLSVVAEGVEDETTMQALAGLHCDDVQGYWITRPLPVGAFLSWHDQWRRHPLNPAHAR